MEARSTVSTAISSWLLLKDDLEVLREDFREDAGVSVLAVVAFLAGARAARFGAFSSTAFSVSSRLGALRFAFRDFAFVDDLSAVSVVGTISVVGAISVAGTGSFDAVDSVDGARSGGFAAGTGARTRYPPRFAFGFSGTSVAGREDGVSFLDFFGAGRFRGSAVEVWAASAVADRESAETAGSPLFRFLATSVADFPAPSSCAFVFGLAGARGFLTDSLGFLVTTSGSSSGF